MTVLDWRYRKIAEEPSISALWPDFNIYGYSSPSEVDARFGRSIDPVREDATERAILSLLSRLADEIDATTGQGSEPDPGKVFELARALGWAPPLTGHHGRPGGLSRPPGSLATSIGSVRC
jgi:hypothetical protein